MKDQIYVASLGVYFYYFALNKISRKMNRKKLSVHNLKYIKATNCVKDIKYITHQKNVTKYILDV